MDSGWLTEPAVYTTVDTACASSGKLWADSRWASINVLWLDNFVPTRGDAGSGGVPADAVRVLVGHSEGPRYMAVKHGEPQLIVHSLTIITSVHDPAEWYSGTQDWEEIQRRVQDPELVEVHHLTEEPESLRTFKEARQNGAVRPRIVLD